MKNVFASALFALIVFAYIAPASSPTVAMQAGLCLENSPAEEKALEVRVVNLKQMKEALKKLNGKVVLLNVWATWCKPCVKEMPDLMKLHRKYADSGFVLVLLSVDDIELRDTDVKKKLEEFKVDFATYLKAEGEDQEFLNGIDKDWSGAIPFTVIYDRTGKRRSIVTGSSRYEMFEKEVKKLL